MLVLPQYPVGHVALMTNLQANLHTVIVSK